MTAIDGYTRLNLNDKVKVKLTDLGFKIAGQNGIKLKVEIDGYHTCLLWQLMADFGPFMQIGTHGVVETTIFIRKDSE